MTERTSPWTAAELVQVDGMGMVYSIGTDGSMVVRLPGGQSASVEMLRADGRDVRLPLRLRIEEAGSDDGPGRGVSRPDALERP